MATSLLDTRQTHRKPTNTFGKNNLCSLGNKQRKRNKKLKATSLISTVLYFFETHLVTSAEVTAGFWQMTNHPFLTTYLGKSSCLWVPICSVLLATIQLRIRMELRLWEEHMGTTFCEATARITFVDTAIRLACWTCPPHWNFGPGRTFGNIHGSTAEYE